MTEEEICISCGLCCDGSFFSKVDLKPDEVAPAVCSSFEPNSFAQPCACLDGKCTVYKARPQTCRDFDCLLLNEVRDQRITANAAKTIIIRIRTHIEYIRPRIETGNFNDELNAFTQRTRSQWFDPKFAEENSELINTILAFEADRRLFCGLIMAGNNSR